jgi:hypothetical protein
MDVMASGRDDQELRERFSVALGARLAPAGWEVLNSRESSFTLAAYRRALEGPFAAIAKVDTGARILGRALPEVTGVSVGVSFEPLRILAPLLDRFDQSLVTESVWPHRTGGDPKSRSSHRSIEISTCEDAEHAVAVVAAEIFEHAVPFAEGNADLDALLRRFTDSDDERERLTPAALLTAAGRFAEAQARLDELAVLEPTERNRWIRRGAYQLRRWIASGGDPAVIPAEFPPRSTDRKDHMPMAEGWGEYQKMRAALGEFRGLAAGKTREQARVILYDTLVRHGRLEQGPSWVENELDHLETTPGERVRSGLHTLARVGLGAAKALQEKRLPDFSAPTQFEPPDHALYQAPHTYSSTRVVIDREARDWLLDTYRHARRHLDVARFTVWLRQTDPDTDAPTDLEVILGDRRIGTITPQAQPSYADLLARAAAREEHPCLDVLVSLHGQDLLLDIGKPT